MKIVCLLSNGKGHLDFGGMGYVRLAKELKNSGCEVVFLTVKEQFEILHKHGFACVEVQNINWLWLGNEDYDYNKKDKNWFVGMKFIELAIQKENPALVLVDRILGLAEGMLKHLQLPYVSVGTPGGLWKKEKKAIVPGVSVHNSNGTLQILANRLRWQFDQLSAWCVSPYLNVVFMGKEFYPHNAGALTRYVDLFAFTSTRSKTGIALSLGSGTGDTKAMVAVFERVVPYLKKDQLIDVFGKEKYVLEFIAEVPEEHRHIVRQRGIVDFKVALQEIEYLIFPGGISTLWYCMDNDVVPIIVSGAMHDQDYNAQRAEVLGLSGDVRQIATLQVRMSNDPSLQFEFTDHLHSITAAIAEMLIQK